jgi:hypothetical protein
MSSIDTTDLCFLPATELTARICRRDLSPVEVVEAYLGRIKDRNPSVNAYTLVLSDQAMDAAREAETTMMSGRPLGPLHGVPVAIKDLDDLAGVPSSMGSLAVQNRVPKTSAAAVERLTRADAIVLGKTNRQNSVTRGSLTICASVRRAPLETWLQFRRLIGRKRSRGGRGHGRPCPRDRRRRTGSNSCRVQRRCRIQAFLWPSSFSRPAGRVSLVPSACPYRTACPNSS